MNALFNYQDACHDSDNLMIEHKPSNSTVHLLLDIPSLLEINLYHEPLCKKCLHPLRDHDHIIAKKKDIVMIKQCTIGVCYCTISIDLRP